LLAFGAGFPVIGMIGIFLFNFTMPITLVVISNLLPGRPGFSFGLTTLALIIGALPTFFHCKYLFSGSWVLLISILFSALAIFIGLLLYNRINKKSFE
jgi:FSR family fosmidomycin resistance protein-like MFS transporter